MGGHHIAFYVDDIEAAVAHLKSHGVTVQGEINRIADGPAAGSAWVYFLAPWGLQLELVSYPNGKGYEAQRQASASGIPRNAGALVMDWERYCSFRF